MINKQQIILGIAFLVVGWGGAYLLAVVGGKMREQERAIVNLCMAQTNGDKGLGYCKNSIFGR